MSRLEWREQWLKTPEARAFYDAIWHDLNRRHYAFRIQDDGSFRIEDVIPGRYEFTVWLEEREVGKAARRNSAAITGRSKCLRWPAADGTNRSTWATSC